MRAACFSSCVAKLIEIIFASENDMSNSKKARELELPQIVAFRITVESRSSRVSDVGSRAVVDLFSRHDYAREYSAHAFSAIL